MLMKHITNSVVQLNVNCVYEKRFLCQTKQNTLENLYPVATRQGAVQKLFLASYLVCLYARPSVCPYVTSSQAWISQKQLKIGL